MNTIGIITLGRRYNYGNRLQNYASDWVWRKIGFEPTSLYICDRPNILKSAKALARKALGKVESDPEANMSDLRVKAFNDFNKHMQMETVSNFEEGI